MKYAVDLIESEAGWGQRVDDTRVFNTLLQAQTYANEFNKSNDKNVVSSWYMYATKPREATQKDIEREKKRSDKTVVKGSARRKNSKSNNKRRKGV